MHFARQVSQHIALSRAGLGFLSVPPLRNPRVFGTANRFTETGAAEVMDSGITR
ncbi:hypothetical protein [Rhizobium oryzicola]|uniref:Uncharacterized protein n=1 Tax=Rhizobium oryzicola TaxID=1232668 RepID=A0ABT8SYS2_9HYPH|nr:hypothetical protein [Rhizobium oryzicola]MDO1583619.1 hypothetical protein [Rhizobium oryzicola]